MPRLRYGVNQNSDHLPLFQDFAGRINKRLTCCPYCYHAGVNSPTRLDERGRPCARSRDSNALRSDCAAQVLRMGAVAAVEHRRTMRAPAGGHPGADWVPATPLGARLSGLRSQWLCSIHNSPRWM